MLGQLVSLAAPLLGGVAARAAAYPALQAAKGSCAAAAPSRLPSPGPTSMAWTVWTVYTVVELSSDAADGVTRAAARVRNADTAGNRPLFAAQWHCRLAVASNQVLRVRNLFTLPAAQKQTTCFRLLLYNTVSCTRTRDQCLDTGFHSASCAQ